MRMGIRVFDRQVDDLAEQFLPELLYDAKAQLRAENTLGQPHETYRQVSCKHEEQCRFQIAVTLSGNDIHCVTLEHGSVDTRKGAAQYCRQHTENQFLLFYEIGSDAF